VDPWLLRAASAALFQVYSSQEILEETRRNLLKSAGVTEQAMNREEAEKLAEQAAADRRRREQAKEEERLEREYRQRMRELELRMRRGA
jgi:hypothetical protein